MGVIFSDFIIPIFVRWCPIFKISGITCPSNGNIIATSGVFFNPYGV